MPNVAALMPIIPAVGPGTGSRLGRLQPSVATSVMHAIATTHRALMGTSHAGCRLLSVGPGPEVSPLASEACASSAPASPAWDQTGPREFNPRVGGAQLPTGHPEEQPLRNPAARRT